MLISIFQNVVATVVLYLYDSGKYHVLKSREYVEHQTLSAEISSDNGDTILDAVSSQESSHWQRVSSRWMRSDTLKNDHWSAMILLEQDLNHQPVPHESSLHPPIDYHWLLLLNVSMIQLVILLIMISSGYYSTILLIIWQLHWLSTHPPTTPLQSTGPNIKIPHNPLITDRRSLSLFFVWFSCQKWLSGNCLTCGFMLKPWLILHVHGNLENLAGGLNLAITESEYLSWLV